jgi:hypothetical protein
MKNKILVTMILIAILLTACGTASITSQSSSINAKAKSYTDQAELIVGIFKLEGTDQAVTAKQASELLPLWEMAKALTDSDTSAREEVEAVTSSVEGTLTSNQLQAITAMNLTDQDVLTFEQSLSAGTVQRSSQSSSKSNSGFSGPPDGGPGGDSLGGIVSGVSQAQGSTTSAQTSVTSNSGSAQVPSALLEALINLLKQRAAA